MRLLTVRVLLFGAVLILYPLIGLASPENTGDSQPGIPPGTKITRQNWQQYKQFMPDGMVALFEGNYFWKMPADLEMESVPALPIRYPPDTRRRRRSTETRPRLWSFPMAAMT